VTDFTVFGNALHRRTPCPDNFVVTAGLGSGLRRGARHELGATEPDERGVMLVELLIGVILLGAVTVALMGSLAAVTRISDEQRQESVVDAEGTRLAEKIAAIEYEPCAVPEHNAIDRTTVPGTETPVLVEGSYSAAIDSNFAGNNGFTFRLVGVMWAKWVAGDPAYQANKAKAPEWIPFDFNPNGPNKYKDTPQCDVSDDAKHLDCGLQKLTVRATAPGGATKDFIFVKRSEEKRFPVC
jgi:hypothetical protein